jgi:phytoene synthase
MVVPTDAVASFEDKWSLAHPELPLALRFVRPGPRPMVSALACVSLEVGLATYGVSEAGVAASKLQWWAEELGLLSSGKARHPLTQVLAESVALKVLPPDAWRAWIGAAFAQRDAAPARGLPDLVAGYRSFYAPLSRIETAVYPGLSVESRAQAGALSRILLDTIRLPESLAAGRLPLPLDLLARHGISSNALGNAGPQRDGVLREHFSALAGAMKSVDRRGLPAIVAAGLAADLRRCQLAAHAANPMASSASNLDRLPFSALWACWRAARRVQPSL